MTDNRMSSQEYTEFQKFLEKSCGIVLGNNRHYLINSRLKGLMSEHDIFSIRELITQLKKPGQVNLRKQIIDAMTTNETSWFRDQHPFEALKNIILPELKQRRSLGIWSAACSSGQEPYTISITIEEYLKSSPASFSSNIKIMATDISSSVLAEAKKATYDHLSISRGLSSERQQKFFHKVGTNLWRLNDELAKRVTFREFNLLDNPASLGRFDVIFCRNVLIYFSQENKTAIIEKFAKVLNPGGYLILGSSESIPAALSESFSMVRANRGIIYKIGEPEVSDLQPPHHPACGFAQGGSSTGY